MDCYLTRGGEGWLAVMCRRREPAKTPIRAGKPEMLYIGAEFCLYCAELRWPLAVALSRC
jgi:hypothetical protein